MEEIIDRWVKDNPDFGDGFGDGSGSGFGDGSGSGFGSGFGSGSGDGSGSGSGDGSGFGYGYGYGSGYGSGSGFGSGDGSGDGSGYGDGYGDGYGYGYNIEKHLGRKVYKIDNVNTIITVVISNYAHGYILNRDLTITPCYIAKGNGLFAHGKTIREAQSSLNEKQMEKMPLEERIEKFKAEFPDYDKKVEAQRLFEWHHILTGSCLMGRQQFCNDRGIDYENGKYSVNEFLDICKNAYGWENVRKVINQIN